MTNELLNTLIKSVQMASKPKTSPYDTTATVKRIEDGIAWVQIPGGVDETPVKLTVNAEAGDTVQVRVSGGTAFLVGNGMGRGRPIQTAPMHSRSIGTATSKQAVSLSITQQVRAAGGHGRSMLTAHLICGERLREHRHRTQALSMDGIRIDLRYHFLLMQNRIMAIIQCGKSGKSEQASLWRVLCLTSRQLGAWHTF